MGNVIWEDPQVFDETIGDRRFDVAVKAMKSGIMKVPKITRDEYEVLKFCHERNMRQFLKEEFEKHPIILDENGGLVGENPFEKERREQALKSKEPIL